jgi:hypothetical protein
VRTLRLLAVLTTAAALLALLSVPSQATSDQSQRVPSGRTAVGDSVMAGAQAPLRRRGFSVDTAISRQVSAGLAVLRAKKRNGTLRRQVVVHLGTNGTFTSGQCRSMSKLVGRQRNLLLLTVKVPRPWTAGNNRVISRCAKRYANTYLLDWSQYVRRHRGIVEGDGYHLTPKGSRKYAALVDRRVEGIAGR